MLFTPPRKNCSLNFFTTTTFVTQNFSFDKNPIQKYLRKITFCFALLLVLFLTTFTFAETKQLNGTIIGIMPKQVYLQIEDILKEGEEIKIIREDKEIAVLKVIKITGKIILTEIVTKNEDLKFTDKIVKEITAETPPVNQQENNSTTDSQTSNTNTENTNTEQTTPTIEQKNNVTQNFSSDKTNETTSTDNKDTALKPTAENKTTNQQNLPENKTSNKQISPADNLSKKLNINFGYSMFGPQNLKYSNSGYLLEFGFNLKLPLGFVFQYAKHNWNDTTAKLNLSSISLNTNYQLFTVPKLLNINATAGITKLSGNLNQNNNTTNASSTGLNYGLSLTIYKYLKLDYKLYTLNLSFGSAKYKSGEQISISLMPLNF